MLSREQRKEELKKMIKKDITGISKNYNLKRYRGKNELSKEELIENILSYEYDTECSEDKDKKDLSSDIDEVKIRYIKTASIGTLVAFKTQNGRAKSAKILKRSTKRRVLKVETKYNKQFIIPFEDVIWIKTGTRWPKGVYKLFKGTVD